MNTNTASSSALFGALEGMPNGANPEFMNQVSTVPAAFLKKVPS